jgi:hypothetical protein
MADELIRYNRIKSVIFKPQTYLSFQSMGYNLLEDEIIILQSLLNQEYFDGLEVSIVNSYKNNNVRDMTQPIQSQVYDNLLHIGKHNSVQEYGVPAKENKHLSLTKESKCQGQKTERIVSTIWKKTFPSDFHELSYENSILCGFTMLIDIIQYSTSRTVSISDLKNDLYEEYEPFLSEYKDSIVDILILEGKKTLGNQVKKGNMEFQEFLFSEDYFITNLDLWILLTKYKIPSIILSSVVILQTGNVDKEFVLYGEPTDSFIFIVSPGLRSENIPKYKLITNPSNDISFSLNKMKHATEIYQAIERKVGVEDYIRGYVVESKAKYKPKKVKLVLKEEPENE